MNNSSFFYTPINISGLSSIPNYFYAHGESPFVPSGKKGFLTEREEMDLTETKKRCELEDDGRED
jgi:hypothetical protein